MAFAALAAGVSGLQAFTQGVGVIADNITNVNTIGFKESRARFSTLVTETSSGSAYSPGGVRAFSETLVSKEGLLQPSEKATDLAVDGSGFFVVKQAPSAEEDGEFVFTRAGGFTQDSEGFLKNTAGLFLMGWPIASDGSLPISKQDLGELRPINISDLNGLAQATTDVSIRANIQATTPINPLYVDPGNLPAGTAVPVFEPGDLADGTAVADFETEVNVFDSQGGSHRVIIALTKIGTNTWAVDGYADNPIELDPTEHPDGLIFSGELVFNGDGTIDQTNSTYVPSSSPEIFYNALPTAPNQPLDQVVNFDFGTDGQRNGFTQYGSVSTTISSSVNGDSFGNVTGVSISTEGDVSALFDNSLTLTVFRLPIATFPNDNGLSRRQGNAYSASDLSGSFNLVEAGTGGGGKIAPNSLELSTVDLANEFAELIKTQRAFSASTRIITTSDEILEELTRL